MIFIQRGEHPKNQSCKKAQGHRFPVGAVKSKEVTDYPKNTHVELQGTKLVNLLRSPEKIEVQL
jgi:hypothetical protein